MCALFLCAKQISFLEWMQAQGVYCLVLCTGANNITLLAYTNTTKLSLLCTKFMTTLFYVSMKKFFATKITSFESLLYCLLYMAFMTFTFHTGFIYFTLY